MIKLSVLGIPNDDNSSFMKGAADAPNLIRRELHCDAYSLGSESGVDFGVAGRLMDHGDIQFDGVADPWDLTQGAGWPVYPPGDRLDSHSRSTHRGR